MIVLTMLLMFIISFITLSIFLFKFILYLFCNKLFPKKIFISVISSILLLLKIYTYYNYFFTFECINRKDIQAQGQFITSPNNTYSAQLFYELYGGAAGGVNIFVELIALKQNNSKKIVYYSDTKQQVILQWLDDKTLSIANDDSFFPNANRSIVLDVTTEIYHESGLACRSFLLKTSYDTCYQHKEVVIVSSCFKHPSIQLF